MTGGIQYYYSGGARPVQRSRLSTSRRELTEIGIAYAVLTVDLGLLFSGGSFLGNGGSVQFTALLNPWTLALAATAGFTGFVAHELAHKIVAQRRGFWAEFRMWPGGLALSFLTALIGFLWGAPGATVVGGMSETDRDDWGRTSLAGPLANFAFGAAFLSGGLLLYRSYAGLGSSLFYLAYINGWFGTFNLLPFGPLDGRKVLRWSAARWAPSIAVTGACAVLSILLFFSMVTYGTPFHYLGAIGSSL